MVSYVQYTHIGVRVEVEEKFVVSFTKSPSIPSRSLIMYKHTLTTSKFNSTDFYRALFIPFELMADKDLNRQNEN